MPAPRHRERPARYRDDGNTGGHPLANQTAADPHNASSSTTIQPLRSTQSSSKARTTAVRRHIRGIYWSQFNAWAYFKAPAHVLQQLTPLMMKN